MYATARVEFEIPNQMKWHSVDVDDLGEIQCSHKSQSFQSLIILFKELTHSRFFPGRTTAPALHIEIHKRTENERPLVV